MGRLKTVRLLIATIRKGGRHAQKVLASFSFTKALPTGEAMVCRADSVAHFAPLLLREAKKRRKIWLFQ